jgi:hypothetical protein
MQAHLLSLFRHLLTGLSGLGAYLFTQGLIQAGDAPAVDAAGQQLVEPVAAVLAMVLTRVILFQVGRYFPSLAPLLSGQSPIAHDGQPSKGSESGGNLLPLLIGMAAALLVVSLPSCRAVEDYDLTGSAYLGSSDAKAGLKFEGGNVVPFGRVTLRDRETGKVSGYAAIQATPKVRATK